MRRLLALIWQTEFLWHLSRITPGAPNLANLRARIDQLPPAQMPGTDSAAKFNRMLAESLRAAVEYLEDDQGMARADARKAAGSAFLRTGEWSSAALIRLWLWLDHDPVGSVQQRGLRSSAHCLLGNGMEADETILSDGVELQVTQCPFADYFWNAARPDLTPILCTWDKGWMEQINAAECGMSARRDGTIAGGCATCTFTLRGAAAKEPAEPTPLGLIDRAR